MRLIPLENGFTRRLTMRERERENERKEKEKNSSTYERKRKNRKCSCREKRKELRTHPGFGQTSMVLFMGTLV